MKKVFGVYDFVTNLVTRSYNFFVSANMLIAKIIILMMIFLSYKLKVMYDRSI